MSGLGLFRLHQPGLRCKSIIMWAIMMYLLRMIFMIVTMMMILMIIVPPGTQAHRMMNPDTLRRPRDQTRTGLRGGFCHHHHHHHHLHHCHHHHHLLHHHHHHISIRALFGPTDHEENLRFVRKELKKAKNEAANKW